MTSTSRTHPFLPFLLPSLPPSSIIFFLVPRSLADTAVVSPPSTHLCRIRTRQVMLLPKPTLPNTSTFNLSESKEVRIWQENGFPLPGALIPPLMQLPLKLHAKQTGKLWQHRNRQSGRQVASPSCSAFLSRSIAVAAAAAPTRQAGCRRMARRRRSRHEHVERAEAAG